MSSSSIGADRECSEDLMDPVTFELLTEAVNLVPCGHVLNETTIPALPVKNCPLCKKSIDGHTVAWYIRQEAARVKAEQERPPSGNEETTSSDQEGGAQEEEEKNDLLCPHHSRPQDLFCEEDGELICLICVTRGGLHFKHSTVPATSEHREEVERIANLKSTFENTQVKCNSLISMCEESVKAKKEYFGKEGSNVKDYFQQVREMIDQREQLLLAQLQGEETQFVAGWEAALMQFKEIQSTLVEQEAFTSAPEVGRQLSMVVEGSSLLLDSLACSLENPEGALPSLRIPSSSFDSLTALLSKIMISSQPDPEEQNKTTGMPILTTKLTSSSSTSSPSSMNVSSEKTSSSSTPLPKKVIHKGIICDNCGKADFSGVRFKCLSCKDYDLCEGCEKLAKHLPDHLFLKITSQSASFPRQRILHTPNAAAVAQARKTLPKNAKLHEQIGCDHCQRENFPGIRYKCANCENFDLCDICEQIQPAVHDPSHLFVVIKQPVPSAFFPSHKAILAQNNPLEAIFSRLNPSSHSRDPSGDAPSAPSFPQDDTTSDTVRGPIIAPTPTNHDGDEDDEDDEEHVDRLLTTLARHVLSREKSVSNSSTTSSNASGDEKLAHHVSMLHDFGFTDESKNIALLRKYDFNMEQVLNELFSS